MDESEVVVKIRMATYNNIHRILMYFGFHKSLFITILNKISLKIKNI